MKREKAMQPMLLSGGLAEQELIERSEKEREKKGPKMPIEWFKNMRYLRLELLDSGLQNAIYGMNHKLKLTANVARKSRLSECRSGIELLGPRLGRRMDNGWHVNGGERLIPNACQNFYIRPT